MRKTKLSDYTPDQVTRFKKMEQDIKMLNQALAAGGEISQSPYTREEIGELSRYQQLVLADRANGN